LTAFLRFSFIEAGGEDRGLQSAQEHHDVLFSDVRGVLFLSAPGGSLITRFVIWFSCPVYAG
jgi:hypothetical protein